MNFRNGDKVTFRYRDDLITGHIVRFCEDPEGGYAGSVVVETYMGGQHLVPETDLLEDEDPTAGFVIPQDR